MKNFYLIALGGNRASSFGSPANTLRAALDTLNELGAVIRAVSSFYHTPAFPAGFGADFVNAAAMLGASWTAHEALEILHEVEARLGRERISRWGQRTIDIDLLAFGDLVLPDRKTHSFWRNLPPDAQASQAPDKLILPHPRLQDRAFVLVPLVEIAPDWVHPLLGLSVVQMLENLPEADKSAVKEID